MAMMQEEGEQIGRFKVRSLMRELALISKQPGSHAYKKATVERVFRSLKSEWIPTTGYLTGQQAQRDIGQYLMGHYNWIRPHQFNDGLAPAKAEEKLKTVSGMS